MLDPVQLWTAPGAQMVTQQQQAATNLFYSELLNALRRVAEWFSIRLD